MNGIIENCCTLFLGDLSVFCSEKDIAQAFSGFGNILDLKIKRNNETNASLCYGFITFDYPSEADNALKIMNGENLCGRPLRL